MRDEENLIKSKEKTNWKLTMKVLWNGSETNGHTHGHIPL